MEIQERLYSVCMTEDELALFSDFTERLYGKFNKSAYEIEQGLKIAKERGYKNVEPIKLKELKAKQLFRHENSPITYGNEWLENDDWRSISRRAGEINDRMHQAGTGHIGKYGRLYGGNYLPPTGKGSRKGLPYEYKV